MSPHIHRLMGGQKYIVHNILFKFATDDNQLFGSDYAAAKVAGNEVIPSQLLLIFLAS